MRIPLLVSLFLWLAAACAGGDDSLVYARRAQALLGSGVWSQVLRIENHSGVSPYPRTVHALVFELAGILWFYTDLDGTQSFSLHRGRLAEEKANFEPLLRDIDPGFQRWTEVAADLKATQAHAVGAELRNGCFIESYVALRRLVARGEAVTAPRLLSYYPKHSRHGVGHTVLAYANAGQVVVIDPLRPDVKLGFPASLAVDPKKLAEAVQGQVVENARVLPLALPIGSGQREIYAANETARSSVVPH